MVVIFPQETLDLERVGNFFSFSAAVRTLAWRLGGELIRLAWPQGCSLTQHIACGLSNFC